MSDISKFLDVAKDSNIIDQSTHQRLEAFRNGGYVNALSASSDGDVLGLDVANDVEDVAVGEASEAPRFVRGFHDVLITIGIVVFLLGLSFFDIPLLAIGAVIVLSEIFVKRQNLALPAFTLTLALCFAVTAQVASFGDASSDGGLFVFAGLVVALMVYYWRYKVPVALAILIWSAFCLVFVGALNVMSGDDLETFLESSSLLVGIIGLSLSIAMFAFAMWLDMKDRLRQTRRSDVAFWLHLGTAPLLLYTSFLLFFGQSGALWSGDPSLTEAVGALCLVTVLMVIGIIIDRRAFVTSGLISLGLAITIVIQKTGMDFTSVSALALISVGVVVLVLGSGWQTLRRIFVGVLPENFQAVLPPITK